MNNLQMLPEKCWMQNKQKKFPINFSS